MLTVSAVDVSTSSGSRFQTETFAITRRGVDVPRRKALPARVSDIAWFVGVVAAEE